MQEFKMDKVFSPQDVEARIYEKWESSGAFKPVIDPDKKPFTIVMPPPNITGQLHVGHALDEMPQDVLIRYHRMKGDPTLWVPGTDHASIATEIKVVEALKAEGISKEDIGREGFLERAWAWKKEYGGRIVKQLRKLGVSCDWSRERFTMDEGLSRAVRETFVRLYEKGLIYRGARIINWCPTCKTALSDAEVEYVEQDSHLWHIRYPGAHGDIIVATTRPETMLGDTGVCVNPADERYKDMVGKTVTLPIMNREIPIVADDYADLEFGTGAVKMTPAHDPNDFEVAQRHNLPIIRVLNDDGTMNENAGKFAGMTREACREAVVEELKQLGLLVKIEPLTHNVGTCYRCHDNVEPLVSTQWFVKMKPLAEPAIEVAKNKELVFVPERFEKTYLNWMENIRDWCISRQLWWGHRIPAFYCDDCGEITVSREDITTCPKCGGRVHQDEDVLDTWFSSALWPFSTLGWPDDTEDLRYFYPNSVLSCGYDIIFFWLARMVFSGIEQMGECPFHVALMHGLVRDAQGRKMSKSLGNGIDPIAVIDKYGADALRFSLEMGVSPGADVRMSEEKIESFRNFVNKIWNASRFVLMNLEGFTPEGVPAADELELCDKWILTKFQETAREITDDLEKFELGLAATKLYDFVWSNFCDWYIELAKQGLNGGDEKRKKATQEVLYYVLLGTLKLLHPYIPFVTEEVYGYLPGVEGMLITARWPEIHPEYDFPAETARMEGVMEVIRTVRNLRAEMNVAPGRRATLLLKPHEGWAEALAQAEGYFRRLAFASAVEILDAGAPNPEKSASAVTGPCELFMPLGELVDVEKEIARLQKDKKNVEGEIARAQGKLNNQGFVSKAPAHLIELEKEKLETNKDLLVKLEARIAEMQQLR
ncbi:MAG TPA: valine--tRNA ligase [Candidatus Pullichristensenella stercorigallinarum]|uniref:Valine--tRNA ligase n=1 Tax=Candidatus Pullichristensenella stercorigallinarum TaxID=2840909 RepID=A0A9D0ZPL5_9FIRM|nr:valine--tRNA ligase [Candidatus Pullichristensenella stercorigallinarum]